MLPSLYIKNYRNLKELSIESLSRINLIAGKNNTGKSSVLEAISIYANRGSLDSILQILEQRGEYVSQNNLEPLENMGKNFDALSSLMYDRETSYDRIEVGPIDLKKRIAFGFIRFRDEERKLKDGSITHIRQKVLTDEFTLDFQVGFEVQTGAASSLYAINRNLYEYIRGNTRINNVIQFKPDNNQFIRTNNIYKEINNTLFDNIALTEKEQYVIDALRIIEPRTERIAFVESKSKNRSAVVKLSGVKKVMPIGSMGDGINRILTIILALVNSSDGYLLIDEFENGLHYTVQDQLWKIVFKLATDLDIQVFATTHSNDCIASFTRILNKEPNKESGKYIRLDNVNGVIEEVAFSPEELIIANNQDIEIR